MFNVIVTDTFTGHTATVDAYDVKAELHTMFPEAPNDVLDAVDQLGDLITNPIWDAEVEQISSFLGLELEKA